MSNYATYPSLVDRVVLLTGGASGIGEATVRAFAAQRAKVGFVDINREAGIALANELGPKVHFEHCDLKDIPAFEAAIEKIRRKLGPPTVLVNNAAHDDRHDMAEVTPEYFDDRIAVNFRHYYFAIKAVRPEMAKAGGGSIINFSSTSWIEGSDTLSVYAAAKAACHGLTRTLRHSLGAQNIRVNTVVPGWVMTERQKALWVSKAGIKHRLELQSLKQLIQPDDLARTVLFLASDDSRMCTGHMYHVEAGCT